MTQRICVSLESAGEISEEFPVNAGLLQGKVLSPVLFNMYVNNLENNFINDTCRFKGVKPIGLMFADDIIISLIR